MYSVVTMVTSEEGSDKYVIAKRVKVQPEMLKRTKFIWSTDCRWSQRLCGGSASPGEDSKIVSLCSLTHTPPAFSTCGIKS